MKAKHITVTLTAIIPDPIMPESLTLPDLAYRACSGLIRVEKLTYRGRPATREEIARAAEFLADWSRNLADFESALEGTQLTGIQSAANFGRSLAVEPEQPAAAADPQTP